MSAEKNLARDLLNLEINVILVDGISSRKLPQPRQVLREIAEKYASFLQRTARRTKAAMEEGSLPGADQVDVSAVDVHEQEPSKFEDLHNRAVSLIKLRDKAREQGLAFDLEVANVLRRVDRNCEALLELVDTNPSLEFTAPGLLQVRKIWEVGTSRVVMQTVVQLDGDIVTLIQTGRETEKDKFLHSLHKDLIHLAISNWQFMVRTATDLVKSGLGAIFKG